MLEHFFENPVTVQSMRSNLLGPHLDPFAALLDELGYTTATIQWQLWRLADFGRWLLAHECRLVELDDTRVAQFMDERLGQGRLCRGQPAVIRHFIAHLREKGLSPPAHVQRESSPLDALKGRYERYLRLERGLSTACVVNYLPIVHRLLTDRFEAGPPQLSELHPKDLSTFVVRHAHTMSPKRAQLMVSALRSFSRFLLQHGEVQIDLARQVPTVADWRLSTIPRYLEPEQVEHLLSACDLSTATGRRDYAILLLLARVGLRAGEVVKLELDDIHWRAGELRIRGKGLTVQRLPLLAEVGKALAAYLRLDRPSCPSRRVFVCMKAPRRGFASAAAVTTLVKRALERAELHPPVRGAHLLRHSLATGLLRNGASMAEIGELLRHQSPATTEIYAKVDTSGLLTLARSWPHMGGES